ncbi:MAG: hypothetical protein N2445_09335, partial [Acidobacteria bacterium]|nr:hypothetical protein [Acidobacteriota bacterium]
GLAEEKYEGTDLFKLLSGKAKAKDFSFSEHVDNFMKAIRNQDFIYVEINKNADNKWGMKVEHERVFDRKGNVVVNEEIEMRMKDKMDSFLTIKNYKEETISPNGESASEIEKQLKSLGYF